MSGGLMIPTSNFLRSFFPAGPALPCARLLADAPSVYLNVPKEFDAYKFETGDHIIIARPRPVIAAPKLLHPAIALDAGSLFPNAVHVAGAIQTFNLSLAYCVEEQIRLTDEDFYQRSDRVAADIFYKISGAPSSHVELEPENCRRIMRFAQLHGPDNLMDWVDSSQHGRIQTMVMLMILSGKISLVEPELFHLFEPTIAYKNLCFNDVFEMGILVNFYWDLGTLSRNRERLAAMDPALVRKVASCVGNFAGSIDTLDRAKGLAEISFTEKIEFLLSVHEGNRAAVKKFFGRVFEDVRFVNMVCKQLAIWRSEISAFVAEGKMDIVTQNTTAMLQVAADIAAQVEPDKRVVSTALRAGPPLQAHELLTEKRRLLELLVANPYGVSEKGLCAVALLEPVPPSEFKFKMSEADVLAALLNKQRFYERLPALAESKGSDVPIARMGRFGLAIGHGAHESKLGLNLALTYTDERERTGRIFSIGFIETSDLVAVVHYQGTKHWDDTKQRRRTFDEFRALSGNVAPSQWMAAFVVDKLLAPYAKARGKKLAWLMADYIDYLYPHRGDVIVSGNPETFWERDAYVESALLELRTEKLKLEIVALKQKLDLLKRSEQKTGKLACAKLAGNITAKELELDNIAHVQKDLALRRPVRFNDSAKAIGFEPEAKGAPWLVHSGASALELLKGIYPTDAGKLDASFSLNKAEVDELAHTLSRP